jgi:hypothetical protein
METPQVGKQTSEHTILCDILCPKAVKFMEFCSVSEVFVLTVFLSLCAIFISFVHVSYLAAVLQTSKYAYINVVKLLYMSS